MPKDNTPIMTKKHLARLEREAVQRRNVVIASIITIALVFLSIGYGVLDMLVLQPAKPVLQVGADKLSTRDFETMVRYARQNTINQYTQTCQLKLYMEQSNPQFGQYYDSSLQQIYFQLSSTDTMGQSVLDQETNTLLVRQYAKEHNITVTSDEIDKAMQENYGFYANGTPTPTPAVPTLEAATMSPAQLGLLTPTPTITPTAVPTTSAVIATATPVLTPTATATPVTKEAFDTEYKGLLDSLKNNANISEADFRKIVENSLLNQKVYEDITKDVPRDQDQVRLRLIQVADQATAQTALDRINGGEDFGKVAAELSTDTRTKAQGGDTNWSAKDSLVTNYGQPVADAAFALANVGDKSQLVNSNNSWYILQLVGHEKRTLSDSDLNNIKNTKYQAWLDAQKAAATIQTFDTWKTHVPTTPEISAQVLQACPPTGSSSGGATNP